MTRALTALLDESLENELGAFVRERGERPYRVGQIVRWVYERYAASFDAMRDLPAALRAELGGAFTVHGLRHEERVAAADGACKHLFRTHDDCPVESVQLPAPDGETYCLSVFSGCPLRCAFCASGTFFNRALGAGEIVDQFLLMQGLAQGERAFSGIVLMGMGEPLLHVETTFAFLRAIMGRAKVGARRITVSTVGVCDGIEALGRTFPQVKLAVSLHAARDDLRRTLVPHAAGSSLAELVEACRRHAAATGGRRITFEYVLLAGVNDAPAQGEAVAALLRGLPACVNLIPFNPFPGARFSRPSNARVAAFARAVRGSFRGEVTIRQSLGGSAAAACGQLGIAAK